VAYVLTVGLTGVCGSSGRGSTPIAPELISDCIAHQPTFSSDTSTSGATPVRSRWNNAIPIAPARSWPATTS
jgi:hypothetical protein